MLHPWMRSAAWVGIGANIFMAVYFFAKGLPVYVPVFSTVMLVGSLVMDGTVRR